MNKRMTLEQKSLLFIKKTRPQTPRHVMLASLVGVFLLAAAMSIDAWSGEGLAPVPREQDAVFVGIVCGEMQLNQTTLDVAGEQGYDFLFARVAPWFEDADYVSASLGNPVGASHLVRRNGALPSPGASFASALYRAGFTVVAIADEHITDYGLAGLEDTRRIMEANGMQTAGMREDSSPGYALTVLDNGFTVATLAFTDIYSQGDSYLPGKTGLETADPLRMKEAIEKADREADLVIVHMNWGQYLNHTVSPRDADLGHLAIDSGADVVIGHHPEVPQPAEIYKGKLIMYSMGDLLGGVYWSHGKETALVRIAAYADNRLEARVVLVNRRGGIPTPQNATGSSPGWMIWDVAGSDERHFQLDRIGTLDNGTYRLDLGNWR